jgi:hypothetical protein
MASKKKSASKLALAVGQAKVQASDLQDRIAPAVEDARERIAPVVADARERMTPVIEDARVRLTPMVEDARGRLTPVVGDAKERLADLAGTVAVKLDESLPDKATPALVTAAAKRSSRKSGRLKKLFVVAGIGAAAAFIAQKLRSNGSEPQWQSTPPGRPTPAPAPSAAEQAAETASAPAAAVAGMAAADAAQTEQPSSSTDQGDDAATRAFPSDGQGGVSVTASGPSTTDAAGGSPDEAASDATDTPHEPTTPDSPAEKIEIKE